MQPVPVADTDLFGVTTLDPSYYTTYLDSKKNIRFFTFNPSSDALLSGSGASMVTSLYTLNKTMAFFDGTLFLNSIKKDNFVRMIVTVNGREVGIEVPKTEYDHLKHLLLKP